MHVYYIYEIQTYKINIKPIHLYTVTVHVLNINLLFVEEGT